MPTEINPGSQITSRIVAKRRDLELGQATGFFVVRQGRTYLVTNWHDSGLLPACPSVHGRYATTLCAIPGSFGQVPIQTDRSAAASQVASPAAQGR
jgi:hypothetical protein